MPREVTREQSHAVAAILMQNVDWNALDMDSLQESVIRDPTGAGVQFTLFLKNGCRAVSIGDMKIVTAPFDPVKFIGSDWKVSADEHDSRNDGLIEVDFNKADFVDCLKNGETRITGEENLKRLKALKQIRYGAGTFMGLWQDYQVRKKNSVLETLFRTKGIAFLDFFGDVLLDSRGNRCVLSLYRSDGSGHWCWYCRWLNDGWIAKRRSAVSSQVSLQK